MKINKIILSAIFLISILPGCDKNIYDRIPAAAVHIDIDAARWVTYGVHGMADSQTFILNKLPVGFQYNVSSATGFGGILLVGGADNQILVFDMACPVERSPEVRIHFDTEELCARCDKCGSTYNVFSANGAPMSGEARTRKFFLQRYNIITNSVTGAYTITR